MHLNSIKTSLIILGITAVVGSRVMFSLFNDPEGPNLLIVMVMAAFLFALSGTIYVFNSSRPGLKKLILAVFIQAIVATFVFVLGSTEKHITAKGDYKNTEYIIDGQKVPLVNGLAETDAAPGSASKIITQYFGNELKIDLNGDSREDAVFLVTQSAGGSGTMFYVVAALNTAEGYVGSDGYFLGDRIAPQNIEISSNPRHRNVVVANYAERAAGEPMTSQPSVGKSAYLKLDPVTMQWGIVEANFEGESR